jgi:hypothetical protein
MPMLKTLVAAGSLAAALVATSAALADKWNMPVRSNERNYFTRNIMQFAEDVKKGHRWQARDRPSSRGLADEAARGKARRSDGPGSDW